MTTLEILQALAAGRIPAERAARELDRAKQQAERQAAREERERAARIKRARQAEAGRAEIAAGSLGPSEVRPKPVGRFVCRGEHTTWLLNAVAHGLPVEEAKAEFDSYEVYAEFVSDSPHGHRLGRPRTEWVKDDAHRYYRPFTRDELLAQAAQLGIVLPVSPA